MGAIGSSSTGMWVIGGLTLLIALYALFVRRRPGTPPTDPQAVRAAKTNIGIRIMINGLTFLVMGAIAAYYSLKLIAQTRVVLPGFSSALPLAAGAFALLGLILLVWGFLMMQKQQ